MKIKIVDEKQNPFLKRKELLIEIDHEGEATPSFDALQQFIIRETKEDPQKVEILNIYSSKGAAIAKSQVHIWEEKKIINKKKVKKEKKPKEEKAAEPKKEEKKEEPKKDEKKPAKKEVSKKGEPAPTDSKKEDKK